MRNGRDQATINMHCLRYDMSPNFLFNKQLEKKTLNWVKAFFCYVHNIRSILAGRACLVPVKRVFIWKMCVRVTRNFFQAKN